MQAYCLNLTGVNLNDTDSGRDEFLAKRIREGADCRLGGTVDATTGVRLAASNRSNINDITTATLRALLENGQDCLGHVDETGDIGVKHDLQVFSRNLRCLCNALDQTTVSKRISTTRAT